jgi:hypothetical protein
VLQLLEVFRQHYFGTNVFDDPWKGRAPKLAEYLKHHQITKDISPRSLGRMSSSLSRDTDIPWVRLANPDEKHGNVYAIFPPKEVESVNAIEPVLNPETKLIP